MKTKPVLYILMVFLLCTIKVKSQYLSPSAEKAIEQLEYFQLHNQSKEALDLIASEIEKTSAPADLAYLYAYQSTIYASKDSLLLSKKLIDLSMENAKKSGNKNALSAAYRGKAFLANVMNIPDLVVKDALEGLKQIENNDQDPTTKYYLNYLLYGAYSKWDDSEKMEAYIRKAQHNALRSENVNLQANVYNGLSSMFQTRFKKTNQKQLLDSSYYYLNQSFALQQKNPKKVSGNTFVITCINLANYALDYSSESLTDRKEKAFCYLDLAEEKLKTNEASSEKWMNVYGIKSGFAKKEGNQTLAEQYLLQGLTQLMNANGNYFRLEYVVNKDLADLALKTNDVKAAFKFQQRAEELLKKSFNEQQLFNAQKLEVQYETEKKDKELQLLKEREAFSRKQNYLYGGIALALLFGLGFMFASYHFKLRYSIEREKKMEKEQELLDLRKKQLEKEALANSLIIDRKNETLKQIQDKIKDGDAGNIQKLIKEEMLIQSDFEDIKLQVQQLHPEFFNRLNEKAIQKLTPLDLKYCTYLYLKMPTKQIAQILHVEPQSVRMFKYRLKQKFGLAKEVDLEDFLAEAL